MGFYPTTVRVLVVDTDGVPLDCCDEDPIHVWVDVFGWSPRRAYLVQGSQFAEAADCSPEELPGKIFMARLDLSNPPPADPESGERIEFPELMLAPPIDEVCKQLGIEQP